VIEIMAFVVNAVSTVDLLLSEELGLLLEVAEDSLLTVVNAYVNGGINCKKIGRSFHSNSANTVRCSPHYLSTLHCTVVLRR